MYSANPRAEFARERGSARTGQPGKIEEDGKDEDLNVQGAPEVRSRAPLAPGSESSGMLIPVGGTL